MACAITRGSHFGAQTVRRGGVVAGEELAWR
jgi:hypothetical protein